MAYKIVLIGDGAVGKTSFLKRHRIGEFVTNYNATLGVEVHPLKFYTNYGPIILNIWDVAGQKKFRGLGSGYYHGSDAAIIMFSVDSMSSYRNVGNWHNKLNKVVSIPVVICGNKVDLDTHRVKAKHITYHRKKSLQYYNISAEQNYHFDKPFLYLCRRLTGKDDLKFVMAPNLSEK